MDGQVRWLYRTKRGLDCDILVCDDRYAEQPEFTHLTKLPSGCYTIPSSGPTPKCLTFTAGAGGASVGFIVSNGPCDIPEDYTMPSLQYSTDGGETWEDYDLKVAYSIDQEDAIPLAEGESVMFKGVNENLAYYLELEGESEGFAIHVQACVEGNVAASGDVTSLLNGVGGNVAMGQYCYFGMFLGCTGLTQAPTLPATTLAEGCYSSMFQGCTGLIQAPALPTTTLAEGCYSRMFQGCTGLIQAPALPTTTLAEGCYRSMFDGCTSLTQAPKLPATTLATNCYNSMFQNCTGLTQAPTLPATTLAEGCYSHMFSGCTGLIQAPALPTTTLAEGCYSSMFFGCTGLIQAPELPATTLANDCYYGMFFGCTGLTQAPELLATTLAEGCYSYMFNECTCILSHDVMTLNLSYNMFGRNSSCTSLTVRAEEPPTIAKDTLTGLKADCVIYVPAAKVEAYKYAQYWSARRDYIQAIQ